MVVVAFVVEKPSTIKIVYFLENESVYHNSNSTDIEKNWST